MRMTRLQKGGVYQDGWAQISGHKEGTVRPNGIGKAAATIPILTTKSSKIYDELKIAINGRLVPPVC
eukprot:scaffold449_cov138-Cylindrotheca_fusiformis.AAC.8